MKNKILIVAPDYPFPPNHGGRLDIWGRIKVFSHLNYRIDLVVTVKEKPNYNQLVEVNKYVDNIFFCKRKNRIIDMLSFRPLQLKSRVTLESLQFRDEYDFVCLETQYVLPVLNNPTLRAKKYLLRLQNDEGIYFRELSKSSNDLWKKTYYFLESYKFRWLERKIVGSLTNIMFISKDEMDSYKRKYPDINAVFLPPPITETCRKVCLMSRKVLFVGSLFMINNQEAIKWYITNVHTNLHNIEGYELVIAGNSRGESLDWLYALISKENNIKVYDSPTNLSNIYGESSVFINPMIHGAGVKLKTIEALMNGVPVVSTTVGNQGTGLVNKKHILVSDDPMDYAKYVRLLLLDKVKGNTLIENAQQYLSKYYKQEDILNRYLKDLT